MAKDTEVEELSVGGSVSSPAQTPWTPELGTPARSHRLPQHVLRVPGAGPDWSWWSAKGGRLRRMCQSPGGGTHGGRGAVGGRFWRHRSQSSRRVWKWVWGRWAGWHPVGVYGMGAGRETVAPPRQHKGGAQEGGSTGAGDKGRSWTLGKACSLNVSVG